MIANKSLHRMANPLRSIAVGEHSRCECPLLAGNDPKQSSEQISDGGRNRPVLEPIGDIPPAEYEAMYYQEQAQAMAA